jgi:diguanylate cyclase (GGDEF)-like protein/PAS domain S-box-containing protein
MSLNPLKTAKNLFTGNLRRQLIFGVALVHAVMMTLFIWDLTERQKDMLLDRQVEQSMALARSISTSAAGWVASRDLYGLQEIVTAQSRYPELVFSMILDRDGQVLAHSDTKHVGYFLKDLPKQLEPSIIAKSPALVDVAAPVILADRFIGWVRIGLGQKQTAERLSQITHDGFIYALLAIVVGSLLAWYMGSRLTRRLQVIQTAADRVVDGDLKQRTGITGNDEVAHVAAAFDQMLDGLMNSLDELEKSEERFDLAMYASNDGLWDWDLKSNSFYYSPRWKNMLGLGSDDVSDRFEDWQSRIHPDDLARCVRHVQECQQGRSRGFEIEYRMKHKFGHWLNILSRATLVTDERGQPTRMVGTNSDVTEKREKEQIIWQQANYDPLTDLPNRKLFADLLEQMVSHAEMKSAPLWVLFLDLDNFNVINDTLGHERGDKLLVQVAERIESVLRKPDVLGRLGGDEFVIVLDEVDDISFIDKLATKLVDVVGQSYQIEHEEIYLSTSIGIAGYPSDSMNADDLIRFAEQSMYAAKEAGKGRFSYFTPELQKAAVMRVQLTSELRQALSGNQFRLCFQPIIDLSDMQVRKAEALIRWIHPEKGIISPGAFIPIAEETGVIGELGDWVISEALRQVKSWRDTYGVTLQISINMSPFQLRMYDDRHDGWLDDLRKLGLDGKDIVLEITEGILLRSEKFVKERLTKYRQRGIKVAIDDFGTGYSSLSYLKEFDIDFLKIDQSFIRRMEEGSSEHALSEAIIVMAHKLGLQVIAEGVEQQHQQAMLQKMECDFVQGYFYAKPMPPEDFARVYLEGMLETSSPDGIAHS